MSVDLNINMLYYVPVIVTEFHLNFHVIPGMPQGTFDKYTHENQGNLASTQAIKRNKPIWSSIKHFIGYYSVKSLSIFVNKKGNFSLNK